MTNFMQTIQVVPLNRSCASDDSLAWAYTRNGEFSFKSTYLIAKGLNPLNPPPFPYAWIWKANTTQRIHLFLWLCVNNSIPLREVLGWRGFNLGQMCADFCKELETIPHVLRECSFSKTFQNNLGIPYMLLPSFSKRIHDWFYIQRQTSSSVSYSCLAFGVSGFIGTKWPFK